VTNGITLAQEDVRHFHRTFCPAQNADYPQRRSEDVTALRIRLVREEIDETIAALNELCSKGTNTVAALADVADGIADAVYVLLGTACALGIDMGPVWDEVQRANMTKVGGPTRVDGKVLKPDGWQAPRVEEEIVRQVKSWHYYQVVSRKEAGI
jgi:predicted HAD superfamily Cof-like phosphohydrolase